MKTTLPANLILLAKSESLGILSRRVTREVRCSVLIVPVDEHAE